MLPETTRMKFILPIVIFVTTIALIAVGPLWPAQLGSTVGIASGAAFPGMMPAASTPERAVAGFLTDIRKRNWDGAHAQLANASELDGALFTKEMAGSNGSLRAFSSLGDWDWQPLHETSDEAQLRTSLRWSTPVGPINEIRDLRVTRQAGTWKVVWPTSHFTDVPPQVIPVNYLRWDLVTSGAQDDWGEHNIDAPHVRIISMNAVSYGDGSVVMGEVVNEDTIPAFINVNATLAGANGNPIDEESSFDKILHVLLPKQVSPYRIDFPSINLQGVKNVRMDVKATLVPASADPVIGVMNQKLETDAQGRIVLGGELLNQSGEVVNIPHVIAAFYDNNGKVVWVSDGYAERALFPQTPEPFVVEIPKAIFEKVHNYHVVVNQYSLGKS